VADITRWNAGTMSFNLLGGATHLAVIAEPKGATPSAGGRWQLSIRMPLVARGGEVGLWAPGNQYFMRKFQITVFAIATLALIAAACCIGKQVGTEFRNAGIATLLFDIVCIQLWPPAKRV
jgi:hypothetical protein